MKNFEQVYEGYYKCIYRFVYRLTGHEEEAKDLTQETFIKLNSHFDSFLNHANPKSWIYKVAANACLNHLKRKEKYRDILDEVGRETSSATSTEEEFIENEKLILLKRSLENLDIRDRIILGLYRDGISYADMAQILKVKKTSVGKTLARAIDKLARQISGEQ